MLGVPVLYADCGGASAPFWVATFLGVGLGVTGVAPIAPGTSSLVSRMTSTALIVSGVSLVTPSGSQPGLIRPPFGFALTLHVGCRRIEHCGANLWFQ